LPEKDVISPDEVLGALKRYFEESGDTEQAIALRIGINHHTLHRWLSDEQNPKKRKASANRILSQAHGILVSILRWHSSDTPQQAR
jgi:hypothetical protein